LRSFFKETSYFIILKEPGGISVADGATKDLVLNLKIDEWLSDIDITDCLNNDNIILDNNSDYSLITIMKMVIVVILKKL